MLILLISFVVIHLLVTIGFTIAITTWRSKSKPEQPTVSIIVAARNEAENLRFLIPKLLKQRYPEFEIIIGLDRCSDESVEFLSTFSEPSLKWIDIQEVPTGWNSKKHALNTAIQSSKGDWLVFTDADCIPNSDLWLNSLSKEMDQGTNIIVGISPYTENGSFLSHLVRFEGFMTFYLYSAFAMLKRPYMAVGRNMAIRKSYFAYSKGYESIKEIQGGDDDLFVQKSRRTGISLAIGLTSLVHTKPANRFRDYMNQKFRHLSAGFHYTRLDTFLLSIYHLLHLLVYLLIAANLGNTFLLPIILFYLFIKFVSYRFVASKIGSGFNYILFPIVDTLYAFMIPIISIGSKLIKDIEWKN